MPRKIFLSTAVLGLLAGCASVPDLGPKPVPAAAGSLESGATFAGTQGEWPGEGWWQGFADPQLDTLIAEAQRAIALLQERRTALISAAVTGQIDVREAAGRAA